jgi:hypothetical protein
MPHSDTVTIQVRRRGQKHAKRVAVKGASRYTVGLAPSLARQVEQFARTTDTSMSKAIATLVRIGLEGQEQRKQEFFTRIKANIANDDPRQQDRLVDEFRNLILGR